MDCERIYVGKADRHHTLPQEQINELLVEKAKEYHCVVRLKGEMSLFSGVEEKKAFICGNMESPIPLFRGDFCHCRASAYAGIPVTHRGVATSFRVITGHQKTERICQNLILQRCQIQKKL